MFVLGIDPGLTRCGYCVLRVSGNKPSLAAMGLIRTDPSLRVSDRLAELWTDVGSLLDEYPISSLAIERVLFQVNVSTAIGVAQASGIVMAQAALRGVDVVEYSPNQVKDAVTGSGSADKVQVQTMVQRLLGLESRPSPADMADAAAIALTHVAFTPMLIAGSRAR